MHVLIIIFTLSLSALFRLYGNKSDKLLKERILYGWCIWYHPWIDVCNNVHIKREQVVNGHHKFCYPAWESYRYSPLERLLPLVHDSEKYESIENPYESVLPKTIR